jgi:hypothetical protein
LGYIFKLINIKQSESEPVVSLKARFSTAFSSLKMGGITIDSALQVGFMLCALLSRYHAVVQEFCLGRHPLTTATLQTVVNQCVNYNKDHSWAPLARMASWLDNPLRLMQRAPALAMAKMLTRPSQQSLSTIMWVGGRMHLWQTKARACSAMTPPIPLTIKVAIAPSSRS